MDITNKSLSITRFASNHLERNTKVQVAVAEQITDDITRQVGVFDLSINKSFTGLNDPQLIPAIQEKLVDVPE